VIWLDAYEEIRDIQQAQDEVDTIAIVLALNHTLIVAEVEEERVSCVQSAKGCRWFQYIT
jgi:hypothetical protein